MARISIKFPSCSIVWISISPSFIANGLEPDQNSIRLKITTSPKTNSGYTGTIFIAQNSTLFTNLLSDTDSFQCFKLVTAWNDPKQLVDKIAAAKATLITNFLILLFLLLLQIQFNLLNLNIKKNFPQL